MGNNMKFLLVVALVAGVRAEAEADPQLLLHAPLVYGAHHAVPHLPVVKSVEVTPAEVKSTPLVTYAHVPYAYNYGLWGHGLPVVLPAAAPVAEAEPAVEAERKKREAEAEADPEADPYYLSYGLHHPYTYGLHHPYVYTAPVVKPVVKTVEVKAPAVTYAYNHLPYTYGYHGYHPYSYGYPYVVTKPVEAEEPAVEAERKKRDAEADPAILASSTVVKTPLTYIYPTYGAHALTYGAYPYATHGAYSGFGYPYAFGLYGK